MSAVQLDIAKIVKRALTLCFAMRQLRFVIVALFILVQSFTIAHAAQNNNAPHEHNGISCEIALIAPDADVTEPPIAVFTCPEPVYQPVSLPPFVSQVFITHYCRAPPGRGPPHLS